MNTGHPGCGYTQTVWNGARPPHGEALCFFLSGKAPPRLLDLVGNSLAFPERLSLTFKSLRLSHVAQ